MRDLLQKTGFIFNPLDGRLTDVESAQ